MRFYAQLVVWTYIAIPAICILLSPTLILSVAKAQQQRAKLMANALAAKSKMAAAVARNNAKLFQKRLAPNHNVHNAHNFFPVNHPQQYRFRNIRDVSASFPNWDVSKRSHWDQQDESMGVLQNMWNMNSFGNSQNDGVVRLTRNDNQELNNFPVEESIVGNPRIYEDKQRKTTERIASTGPYFGGRNVYDALVGQGNPLNNEIENIKEFSKNFDIGNEDFDETFDGFSEDEEEFARHHKNHRKNEKDHSNYYYPEYNHYQSDKYNGHDYDFYKRSDADGLISEDMLTTDPNLKSYLPAEVQTEERSKKKRKGHHHHSYDYTYYGRNNANEELLPEEIISEDPNLMPSLLADAQNDERSSKKEGKGHHHEHLYYGRNSANDASIPELGLPQVMSQDPNLPPNKVQSLNFDQNQQVEQTPNVSEDGAVLGTFLNLPNQGMPNLNYQKAVEQVEEFNKKLVEATQRLANPIVTPPSDIFQFEPGVPNFPEPFEPSLMDEKSASPDPDPHHHRLRGFSHTHTHTHSHELRPLPPPPPPYPNGGFGHNEYGQHGFGQASASADAFANSGFGGAGFVPPSSGFGQAGALSKSGFGGGFGQSQANAQAQALSKSGFGGGFGNSQANAQAISQSASGGFGGAASQAIAQANSASHTGPQFFQVLGPSNFVNARSKDTPTFPQSQINNEFTMPHLQEIPVNEMMHELETGTERATRLERSPVEKLNLETLNDKKDHKLESQVETKTVDTTPTSKTFQDIPSIAETLSQNAKIVESQIETKSRSKRSEILQDSRPDIFSGLNLASGIVHSALDLSSKLPSSKQMVESPTENNANLVDSIGSIVNSGLAAGEPNIGDHESETNQEDEEDPDFTKITPLTDIGNMGLLNNEAHKRVHRSLEDLDAQDVFKEVNLASGIVQSSIGLNTNLQQSPRATSDSNEEDDGDEDDGEELPKELIAIHLRKNNTKMNATDAQDVFKGVNLASGVVQSSAGLNTNLQQSSRDTSDSNEEDGGEEDDGEELPKELIAIHLRKNNTKMNATDAQDVFKGVNLASGVVQSSAGLNTNLQQSSRDTSDSNEDDGEEDDGEELPKELIAIHLRKNNTKMNATDAQDVFKGVNLASGVVQSSAGRNTNLQQSSRDTSDSNEEDDGEDLPKELIAIHLNRNNTKMNATHAQEVFKGVNLESGVVQSSAGLNTNLQQSSRDTSDSNEEDDGEDLPKELIAIHLNRNNTKMNATHAQEVFKGVNLASGVVQSSAGLNTNLQQSSRDTSDSNEEDDGEDLPKELIAIHLNRNNTKMNATHAQEVFKGVNLASGIVQSTEGLNTNLQQSPPETSDSNEDNGEELPKELISIHLHRNNTKMNAAESNKDMPELRSELNEEDDEASIIEMAKEILKAHEASKQTKRFPREEKYTSDSNIEKVTQTKIPLDNSSPPSITETYAPCQLMPNAHSPQDKLSAKIIEDKTKSLNPNILGAKMISKFDCKEIRTKIKNTKKYPAKTTTPNYDHEMIEMMNPDDIPQKPLENISNLAETPLTEENISTGGTSFVGLPHLENMNQMTEEEKSGQVNVQMINPDDFPQQNQPTFTELSPQVDHVTEPIEHENLDLHKQFEEADANKHHIGETSIVGMSHLKDINQMTSRGESYQENVQMINPDDFPQQFQPTSTESPHQVNLVTEPIAHENLDLHKQFEQADGNKHHIGETSFVGMTNLETTNQNMGQSKSDHEMIQMINPDEKNQPTITESPPQLEHVTESLAHESLDLHRQFEKADSHKHNIGGTNFVKKPHILGSIHHMPDMLESSHERISMINPDDINKEENLKNTVLGKTALANMDSGDLDDKSSQESSEEHVVKPVTTTTLINTSTIVPSVSIQNDTTLTPDEIEEIQFGIPDEAVVNESTTSGKVVEPSEASTQSTLAVNTTEPIRASTEIPIARADKPTKEGEQNSTNPFASVEEDMDSLTNEQKQEFLKQEEKLIADILAAAGINYDDWLKLKGNSQSTKGDQSVATPNLVEVPEKRSVWINEHSTYYRNARSAMKDELDSILGSQRERLSNIQKDATGDDDLLMISFIGDSIIKDLENRRDKVDLPKQRSKREIENLGAVSKLLANPNTKIDVPKTFDNVGAVVRQTFESPKAPMYHVRNMLGNTKNTIMSAAKIPPNNIIVPSQYQVSKIGSQDEQVGAINQKMLISRSEGEKAGPTLSDAPKTVGDSLGIMDTFHKIGGMVKESMDSGKNVVYHANDAASDARNAFYTAGTTVPRLIIPPRQLIATRSALPGISKPLIISPRIVEMKEDALGSQQQHPDQFVGMGQILDAVGLTKPEHSNVELQQIVLNHSPLKHHLLKQANPLTLDEPIVEQTKSLLNAEKSVGTKNLREFFNKMHQEMKEILTSQHENRKRIRNEKLKSSKARLYQKTKDFTLGKQKSVIRSTKNRPDFDETNWQNTELPPEILKVFTDDLPKDFVLHRQADIEMRDVNNKNTLQPQNGDQTLDMHKRDQPNFDEVNPENTELPPEVLKVFTDDLPKDFVLHRQADIQMRNENAQMKGLQNGDQTLELQKPNQPNFDEVNPENTELPPEVLKVFTDDLPKDFVLHRQADIQMRNANEQMKSHQIRGQTLGLQKENPASSDEINPENTELPPEVLKVFTDDLPKDFVLHRQADIQMRNANEQMEIQQNGGKSLGFQNQNQPNADEINPENTELPPEVVKVFTDHLPKDFILHRQTDTQMRNANDQLKRQQNDGPTLGLQKQNQPNSEEINPENTELPPEVLKVFTDDLPKDFVLHRQADIQMRNENAQMKGLQNGDQTLELQKPNQPNFDEVNPENTELPPEVLKVFTDDLPKDFVLHRQADIQMRNANEQMKSHQIRGQTLGLQKENPASSDEINPENTELPPEVLKVFTDDLPKDFVLHRQADIQMRNANEQMEIQQNGSKSLGLQKQNQPNADEINPENTELPPELVKVFTDHLPKDFILHRQTDTQMRNANDQLKRQQNDGPTLGLQKQNQPNSEEINPENTELPPEVLKVFTDDLPKDFVLHREADAQLRNANEALKTQQNKGQTLRSQKPNQPNADEINPENTELPSEVLKVFTDDLPKDFVLHRQADTQMRNENAQMTELQNGDQTLELQKPNQPNFDEVNPENTELPPEILKVFTDDLPKDFVLHRQADTQMHNENAHMKGLQNGDQPLELQEPNQPNFDEVNPENTELPPEVLKVFTDDLPKDFVLHRQADIQMRNANEQMEIQQNGGKSLGLQKQNQPNADEINPENTELPPEVVKVFTDHLPKDFILHRQTDTQMRNANDQLKKQQNDGPTLGLQKQNQPNSEEINPENTELPPEVLKVFTDDLPKDFVLHREADTQLRNVNEELKTQQNKGQTLRSQKPNQPNADEINPENTELPPEVLKVFTDDLPKDFVLHRQADTQTRNENAQMKELQNGDQTLELQKPNQPNFDEVNPENTELPPKVLKVFTFDDLPKDFNLQREADAQKRNANEQLERQQNEGPTLGLQKQNQPSSDKFNPENTKLPPKVLKVFTDDRPKDFVLHRLAESQKSDTKDQQNQNQDQTLGLYLAPELMKPFMGQPNEDTFDNFLRENGDEVLSMRQNENQEQKKTLVYPIVPLNLNITLSNTDKPLNVSNWLPHPAITSRNTESELRPASRRELPMLMRKSHPLGGIGDEQLGQLLGAKNPLMFERLVHESLRKQEAQKERKTELTDALMQIPRQVTEGDNTREVHEAEIPKETSENPNHRTSMVMPESYKKPFMGLSNPKKISEVLSQYNGDHSKSVENFPYIDPIKNVVYSSEDNEYGDM